MKIKVCPRCGSEDVEWIIPQNWSMWSCNHCEYTGAIIEVDNTVQKKIQEHYKHHKHEIHKHDYYEDVDDLTQEEFEEKLDKLFEE
ncbi:MAG: hypothetical protein IJJ47_06550 [Methanosphaera sp.]|nr:hypothetical protein [Methanosphaera sp.]